MLALPDLSTATSHVTQHQLDRSLDVAQRRQVEPQRRQFSHAEALTAGITTDRKPRRHLQRQMLHITRTGSHPLRRIETIRFAPRIRDLDPHLRHPAPRRGRPGSNTWGDARIGCPALNEMLHITKTRRAPLRGIKPLRLPSLIQKSIKIRKSVKIDASKNAPK